MTQRNWMVCILFFLFGSNSEASIIHVPADQPTIQTAINIAVTGDTVLIADGIYTGIGNRDIDFGGKAITVQSENGPVHCIINCGGSETDEHRGFYFHSGEDGGSILNGITIVNGFVDNLNDGAGGGILIENSSPLISHCDIGYNYADENGGGIFISGDPAVVLMDCRFLNNRSLSGAGVAIESSEGEITRSVFTSNECSFDGAGCNFYISEIKIHSSHFELNFSEYGSGGCVFNNYSPLEIMDSTFLNNEAFSSGGAIYSTGETFISNCMISGNRIDNYGGGLYIENAIVQNCLIASNMAEEGAGAYLKNSEVFGCIFDRNTAFLNGAGIYVKEENRIGNCLFSENYSVDRGGGVYLLNSPSDSEIENCTFAWNSAYENGGGISLSSSDPSIVNCIFWENYIDEIYVDASSSPIVSYSDIRMGYPGTGNFDSNPAFVTGPSGDYYLSQTASGQMMNSPCIDTGNDLAENICLEITPIAICMDELTTRTDLTADTTTVNIGFHYPLTSSTSPSPTPSMTPWQANTWTPTPYFSPSPTRTQTPFRSPTPTPANRTATPTVSPTGTPPTSIPSPTFTPTPPSYSGLELLLDDTQLKAGDVFYLHFYMHNQGVWTLSADVYILLEVYGSFWCYPSWISIDQGIDYKTITDIYPQMSYHEQIFRFQWPAGVSPMQDLIFWGASFEVDTFNIIGDLQIITWGWS